MKDLIEGVTITDFVEGDYLSQNEISRLLLTVVDDENGVQYYPELVRVAKELAGKMTRIGNSVLHVSTPEGKFPTVALVMTTVRLINLAKKGRYIIVIGDEIAYLPVHMRGLSEQDVRTHITITATIAGEDMNQPGILGWFKKHTHMMKLMWTVPV